MSKASSSGWLRGTLYEELKEVATGPVRIRAFLGVMAVASAHEAEFLRAAY